MPIGIIINSLAIIFGGVFGGVLGHHLTDEFKEKMNMVFASCSFAMGISAVGLMVNMPAVIFAIVLGTAIGILLKLGQRIEVGARLLEKGVSRFFPSQSSGLSEEAYMMSLITIIVLFCASGTGIYGSLESGMTGDATVLISKSILDFFTAAIFATQLGYVVSAIAIPQFTIFFSLFLLAGYIVPLTTPDMVNDFKACGGIIMIATGFRILKLKSFPVSDMIFAMILVMPLSWLWANVLLPLL